MNCEECQTKAEIEDFSFAGITATQVEVLFRCKNCGSEFNAFLLWDEFVFCGSKDDTK